MIIRRQDIVLLLGSVLLPTVALAGPIQDGEAQLRATYADYRIALFQSSAGNAEATTKALQTLGENWGALKQQWTSAPPPQYADDVQLPETLEQVRTVISNATEAAGQGDLPKAHTTLEAIRSEIGDLHGRNGLIGFSDRMNAYHAEMEKVLDSASDAAADTAEMQGAAAVLAFLAAEIAAHPAPEANDPAYAPLVDALLGSVNALQSAAESGDAAAVKAAIAGLKPAYSKLFVKFG